MQHFHVGSTRMTRWQAAVMAKHIEHHFMEEVQSGIERLKREISYNPTYFKRMVAELGPVEASRQLVRSPRASDGFTKLWEHQKLDLAVEALTLLPWYAPLFDDQDRVAALAGRKPTRRPREQRLRHWPESPPTGARRQTSWSTDCGLVTDHSWRLPLASSKMFTFGILYARPSYPVNRQNAS
jgi:hypothetical protein